MNIRKPPHVEDDAPGLIWRPIKAGWMARWRARPDLVERGYTPKGALLWSSTAKNPEPSATSITYIAEACQRLQNKMLIWGRGGIPEAVDFDGTWRGLIHAYQTDALSNFRKVRYATRRYYTVLCKRIIADHGDELVQDFKVRDAILWHQKWSEGGKIALAHAMIGMVRTLVNFGADFLEDEHCIRVAGVLHRQKFKQAKSRDERLTVEQVNAVRAEAHKQGRHSIALAQAFQFDCTFRQKDIIGERVPLTEEGISEVIIGNEKWLRGIRWEEIDGNLILRHTTSKRLKEVEIDLKHATMVMEELRLAYPGCIVSRAILPAKGPVIISERTSLPWSANEFRRVWRMLATDAGIPKTVRNMDSRAGAITEALSAGARLQSVRKAATHSTEAMTQRYSRGDSEEIAEVMQLRAASRDKKGTKGV